MSARLAGQAYQFSGEPNILSIFQPLKATVGVRADATAADLRPQVRLLICHESPAFIRKTKELWKDFRRDRDGYWRFRHDAVCRESDKEADMWYIG